MNRLPLIIIIIVLSLGAQGQGIWTATPYPEQIIKLNWTHGGITRNEQISNAVVLKATGKAAPVTEPKNIAMATPDKVVFGAEDRLNPAVIGRGDGVTVSNWMFSARFSTGFDSGHVRGMQIRLNEQAQWLGGGERATAMNRIGQRISLYNAPHYGYAEGQDELNFSVPFVMSTEGYGLFFDNPSKGYIDFGKTTIGIMEAGFASGSLDVYVIPGETPADILRKYALLTGRQPLPPRWALGNFVSRFGYRNQRQAEEVIARMQADSFPVDAIVIDLFWFGDSIQHTLGNLDWKRDKWPNPEKMITDFRKQKINTILVTEPFVLKNTKQFNASQPFLAVDSLGNPYMLREFYFGYGGMIDMYRQPARQWFWQFYKKQTDKGIAGWWGDLGEPEKHPSDVFHNMEDYGIKRRMSANEVHNMYGHLWSEMLYNNWKKSYPNERLFFLNRAGFAGSQRYSIFPWTGDVSRSWSGLRAQLPILQSMSLSGIPYLHSDAGGFSMTDKADAELYTRWLQFAAYTPVFRPHGTALGADLTPPGIVDLPSEPAFWDDATKAIVRQAIYNRYRLLPYNYTLAWEQTTLGKPLMRPMSFYNIHDTALLQATDQYMWGDALLIAPVLQPGQRERKIYLPHGQWYDYVSHTFYNGNQWIKAPLTLAHIPVFVKAGAFVPVWQQANYTSTAAYTPATPLTFQFYPGENGQYIFFDDDGNNPNSLNRKKSHQLLQLTATENKNNIIIQIEPKNWPTRMSRPINLAIASRLLNGTYQLAETALIKSVKMNGREIPDTGWGNDENWLNLPILYKGQKVTVQIEW